MEQVAASSELNGPLPLVLDGSERRIRGFDMLPLLRGELLLLRYLGGRPQTWHSSYSLAVRVYSREDATARQLVWKYASTLRKKLAVGAPGLIEVCRRRGYSCRVPVVTVEEQAAAEAAAVGLPAPTFAAQSAVAQSPAALFPAHSATQIPAHSATQSPAPSQAPAP
jgi:DNA-binding winged helix-turn-helix (wHTH) protein